jgi:hypothetical protein
MSHEEIIGQLFYQDNRCGCDECLESSQKAMMKMALSKDRPSAYRVALALSEYEDGLLISEGFALAVHTHNQIEDYRETNRGSGIAQMNQRELRAKRWATAIDVLIDCGRVEGI